MRRGCSFLGLAFLLVACGGGSSSPTANAAATTTRSAEQTQVSAVLTPAAKGSAVALSTAGAGSPSSGLLIPTAQGTRPASISTGSAPAGTTAAAPSAATAQVVKVTAGDGANLRDKPDTNGQIVGKADYGAELPMLEANVPGADGTSRWFRVSFEGKTAFIRNDLASGPQAPSPPQSPTAKP